MATSLGRHPNHLYRYASSLPAWKRSPIDKQLPWFSFGAIDFLEDFTKPTHDVFEFGSGGSSIFFARRARSVRSVENSKDWHSMVTATARRMGLSNLSCELHEFGDAEAHRFRELPYFSAIGPGPYDIVVVDGFCGFSTGKYGLLRPHAFDLALQAVRRPGGIIVVDDSWMFRELETRASGAELAVFESTGPCRYGVTATAIYRF